MIQLGKPKLYSHSLVVKRCGKAEAREISSRVFFLLNDNFVTVSR